MNLYHLLSPLLLAFCVHFSSFVLRISPRSFHETRIRTYSIGKLQMSAFILLIIVQQGGPLTPLQLRRG
jgi:hypothetical protein